MGERARRLLYRLVLSFASLLVQCVQAGQLDISPVPLGTGAGITVRPNLMFILDDSGSMDSDYMPDWISDKHSCPDPGWDEGVGGWWGHEGCKVGDPPYSTSSHNTIYYDPAIRYWPPKSSTGTDWDNASKTEPRNEPFIETDSSTMKMVEYPNIAWCKETWNTPTGVPESDANCAYYPLNTEFIYPQYPDATYKYRQTYKGPPVYFLMSGLPKWCTDSGFASCQDKRDASHTWPKFSAAGSANGTAAWRSFYIIQANNTGGSKTIDIKYNGTTIASLSVNYSNSTDLTTLRNRRNELKNAVVNAINSSISGFTAIVLKDDSSSTSKSSKTCATTRLDYCAQIKVTAPGGTFSTNNTSYNGKSFDLAEPTGIDFEAGPGLLGNGVDYVAGTGGVKFTRIQIKPGQTYTKYSDRTDCTGGVCTYDEELQNFANWYSFYRKRMSMTKTAISRAFAGVSDTAPGAGFRVGLMTISAGAEQAKVKSAHWNTIPACWNANKLREVPIADFTSAHKSTFYTNLFAVESCSYTPLCGALARAGQVFAHTLGDGTKHDTITNNTYDPVQFSCQQSFAFLSTDGYWNSNIESGSFWPKEKDRQTDVGDQDGSAKEPYKDTLSKANTLADVAMYYYQTDLRPDIEETQRMVTFTMGLGVDGTIGYSPYYDTGGSPDYNKILQGTTAPLPPWPDPIVNTNEERIDDLWHAAVNGRGKYFSAKSPNQVTTSLTEALAGVSAMSGSAAAAATSNLEPVAGDNYAYVASYMTQTWEGNIEARTIDLNTGTLSSAEWSAQSLLDTKAGSATTPGGASGPGSRVLYSFNSSLGTTDKKFLLTWPNAVTMKWDGSDAAKDYFNPAQLNQCSPIANCPLATRANLFAYLMGGANTSPPTYRARAHVLGDIVNSQPVFVKKPDFNYTDDGYGTFKATSRASAVYVGANDGFLHAFDADTGEERWAYMPSAVLPLLHELAFTNYGHRYYVDGTITVGDIKVGTDWKTVLVGGLNKGGNTYYALDVTDPANPLALWEFSDARMGYSYGNPIITKLPSGVTSSGGADIGGKWVALVTSGYNNGTSIGSHDGQGILYVLDAYTGTEFFRLYSCTDQSDDATCAGSSGSPSGLAKINAWADDPSRNNTALYVYGGDLEGNLWRFDMSHKSVFKIASIGEPITVKPELAEVQSKRVIAFGTGIFLQSDDKSDQTKRSIYAIKDDPDADAALTNVKASGALVQQTLSLVAGSTGERTITSPQTVDWGEKSGWFVELLEARERVNVDPKLQLGTLVVASNVPDATNSTACTTGGHSWLNFLDIATGSYVVNDQSNAAKIASTRNPSALAVGINIVKLPNGKLITITTTSDNQHPVQEAPVGTANLPTRRVSWRELVTE